MNLFELLSFESEPARNIVPVFDNTSPRKRAFEFQEGNVGKQFGVFGENGEFSVSP